MDDHTDPTAELGRLLALFEKQANLLDPENLPAVVSAVTKGLAGVFRKAINPPPPGPAGVLATSPAPGEEHAAETAPAE